MEKLGIVFRDDNGRGREGVIIGDTIVRLQGSFDCEYKATQLLNVRTSKWKGNPPKLPLQFLGQIYDENLENALKRENRPFGYEVID